TIEEIVTIGRLRSTALDVVGARLEEDVVSDFLSAAAIARVGDSTVSVALRAGLDARQRSVRLRPRPRRALLERAAERRAGALARPHAQRDPARHLPDRHHRSTAGAKGLLTRRARSVRRRQ